MNPFRAVGRRVASLVRPVVRPLIRREEVERDLDEEMRFHLEMAIERNLARGMSPEEARRRARREFGGVEQAKEACRDEWSWSTLERVWKDVRYSVRSLRRSPGYTLVVVLILALGIGANTAIFSVVHDVLLRPLPYPHGDDLVVFHEAAPGAGYDELRISAAEVRDYREQLHALAGLSEVHTMSFTLMGREHPERVETGVVSSGFFGVLGVQPILGRSFRAADETPGAAPVLILSNRYWRQSFGADPNIVGRVFQMNDRPHRVIGVLPELPPYPLDQDLFMTTSACPFRAAAQKRMDEDRHAGRMMELIGRLAPGVSLDQANAEVAAVARRFVEAHPKAYPADLELEASLDTLRSTVTREARPVLLILLGMTGIVLLIACANLANLSLARLLRRERELAARAALGASRGRLVRQLLIESTLVALAGGVAGLVVAHLGLGLVSQLARQFSPRMVEVGLDTPVLGFTLVLSCLSGLFFGVMALPSRSHLAEALKSGTGHGGIGRRHRRVRNALVVGQVSLAVVLLAGAGLMVRSVVLLHQIDLGFNPDRVVTAEVHLDWSHYSSVQGQMSDDEADTRSVAFWNELVERVRAVPGVVEAAAADRFPLAGGTPFPRPVVVEGQEADKGGVPPQVDVQDVSPGFFRVLGVPVLSGRPFDRRDRKDGSPVLLVNRSAARHLWGDGDPVGHRLSLDDGKSWATVVGVVADYKDFSLRDTAAPDEVFRPVSQSGGAFRIIARTEGPPDVLAGQIRDLVLGVDPTQPVANVRTLSQVLSEQVASPRLTALLFSSFAVLALAIALTGIAGTLAFSVGQRTRELGLRMALGADRSSVLWLVVRQGTALVACGLAIGLATALASTRFLDRLLFGVGPADPVTLCAVAGLLLLAAGVACWIPARRATGVDPSRALQA